MRRILTILGISVAGATAGYALHQLRPDVRAHEEEAPTEIVVAAPVSVVLIAFVSGLLAGTRGRLVAFLTGIGTGAACGAGLDDHLAPLVRSLQERAAAMTTREA